MNRFTTDNTEGYSASDIADLNAEFARRVIAEGIDVATAIADADMFVLSHIDHIAARVLADFDAR